MILPVTESKLLVAHRGQLVAVERDSSIHRKYKVSSSALIRFVEGDGEVFAIKHHDFAEPPVRVITAHHSPQPAQPAARLEIDDDWHVTGSGEGAMWQRLPALYSLVFPYVLRLTDEAAVIVRLPGIPSQPDDPDDPYKLVPCPDGQTAIVTSTRAGGRFVAYDLSTGDVRADLTLGHGPPVFRFRDKGRDLWLAHSDSMFRIDTTTWTVVDGIRLSDRPNDSIISDLQFNRDGTRCAVAYSTRQPIPLMQPYRMAPVDGEVLVFDTASFTVTHGTATDRWTDEVTFVSPDTVALRERSSELHVRWADLEPQEVETYPPRDPDDPTWG